MSYPGYFYSATGGQLFPTPRNSPGKYRPYQRLSREVKRSISEYDHSELVSISASICCRIPALRAAIRDKNSWAFSNWLPLYMGDDEAWGEAAEEYLTHEVMPNALFRELRQDFAWGMRVSGMGLDIYGDDLCIFTEDEQHNPKIDIIPGPRIGSGISGLGWASTVFNGALQGSMRADGLGIVTEGPYKDCGIYNGMIRRGNQWVACRVQGFNDAGNAFFYDIPLNNAAHFACEMEFLGMGRSLPRPAASVLHWMKKEEIDDQFLKGLANAARRAVIHKLPPGQDASQSLGNKIQETTVTQTNADGTTSDRAIFVEYTEDGNVQYIGSDEELAGIDFENPHPNAEAFAVRILMECLSDLGWSYELLDSSSTGRAPTRLVAQKANNSINERQSIQEARSIRFFQHAIAKGMEHGRIPMNRNGIDPYKWAIGFPATITIDQGNDITAALQMLKMGLTNERIECAKSGHIAKKVLKQREKEVCGRLSAADRAYKFAQGLGHKEFTFKEALELLYQPNPNSAAQPTAPYSEKPATPAEPPKK